MDVNRLEYAVMKYGTPLYVFDIEDMMRTANSFRANLADTSELCFAMKANPFLVRYMANEVNRIEVCSMGEYRICREMNIPFEKLFISGVLKKKEELTEILEACGGACTYTVESLNQYLQYAYWCDENEEELNIFLRLTSGNQFGMDQQTIQNIFKMNQKTPKLKIRGIHYFSGTQKKSMKKIKEELQYLDEFLLQLEKKYELKILELEYGPGINVPYFHGETNQVESDLVELKKLIDHMGWKGKVTCEMGRALTAHCGYYLTRILDLKKNSDTGYCIVDGGMHHLNYDGQIYGMREPYYTTIPIKEVDTVTRWTVCGSLCTGNDVLIKNANIRNPEIGMTFVFRNTGAYAMTEGMSLFLSHPLPKVAILSNENGWKLRREKQETYILNMEQEI